MSFRFYRRPGQQKRLVVRDEAARVALWLDPLEGEEQENFVKYLELLVSRGQVVKFTSIPNHTRTPYAGVLAKLKREGLRKWFPDMIIVYRKKNGKKALLIVEMKTLTGSTKPEQKEWIAALEWIEGVSVVVAKGCESAINFLSSHICDI